MSAFCTMFDSRYFSRGIAMCESLLRHLPSAKIYVYALDEDCFRGVRAWGMPQVQAVPQSELEDDALRAVRPKRSWAEYCWTCTPYTVRHTLDRFGEKLCVYVDADVYFYASPKVLLDELDGADVMITEHRYSPAHDRTATSGIYNVQFIPFRDTPEARATLEWWRAACLDACELNPDKGRCGDQKYLDDWTTRFSKIHVMRNLGGGVAPWNVQQYSFRHSGRSVIGTVLATGEEFDLIFYHFHALRMTVRRNVQLTGLAYPLTADVVDLIYRPYVRHMLLIGHRLRGLGLRFDPHGAQFEPIATLRERLSLLRRRATALWSGTVVPPGNANRVYHASEL